MITNTEGTAEAIILMEDDAHTAWERLKEKYEGNTRTNLTGLLSGVIKLQFDNRTATIDEHIEFQIKLGRLRWTVAGATDTTQAAGAYAVLTRCDSAKAQILLGTLRDYYKMVVNTSPHNQKPHLPERHCTTPRPHHTERQADQGPGNHYAPDSFAGQSSRSEQTCDYCRKTKGWSGRGRLEADYRTKNRDVEFKQHHQAHHADADEEGE